MFESSKPLLFLLGEFKDSKVMSKLRFDIRLYCWNLPFFAEIYKGELPLKTFLRRREVENGLVPLSDLEAAPSRFILPRHHLHHLIHMTPKSESRSDVDHLTKNLKYYYPSPRVGRKLAKC